ncbi:MAG: hypothetical protein LUE14_13320 [Clostridiales bacterium]|nr:hypothetical protein [Clostridiales bacterium]
MGNKKAFLGYDLGDGESITDIVVTDTDLPSRTVRTDFSDMPMPDCEKPGEALPTIFARDRDGEIIFAHSIQNDPESAVDIRINFKRRPTDLIENLNEEKRKRLLRLFKDRKEWPGQTECPECHTVKMDEFRSSAVTFTNAVFSDRQYCERIRSLTDGCSEIVFCAGHPTRWDDLDAAIYKAILQTSVLGKGTYANLPSSIVMAAESRAAFLYVKDQKKVDRLKSGESALLIDVGSSTIDLTAMTADSRNHQYNSGNNYLGARGIDLIIRDWYLEQLMRDRENLIVYQELMAANPSLNHGLTLLCRRAKEQVCSYKNGKSRIYFGLFRPVLLTAAELDRMLREVPVADVLRKYADLPSRETGQMAGKSWNTLFYEFLHTELLRMQREKIKIGRVILTGSASKVPIVAETVRSVFRDLPETALFFDMDPSRTISKGLALVGPSNDKSLAFQLDVSHVLRSEVPEIVRRNLPRLFEELSQLIGGIMESIVIAEAEKWRIGAYRTFGDMNSAIEAELAPQRLEPRIRDRIINIFGGWCGNVIGKDIALSLKKICEKNAVSEFSVDHLSFMTAGNSLIRKSSEIIMGSATKTAMNEMTVSICNRIIAMIVLLLLVVPGFNVVALVGGGGAVLLNALRNREEGADNRVAEFMMDKNIPTPMRRVITMDTIRQKVGDADIKGSCKAAFMARNNQESVLSAVLDSLGGQVQEKMDEIKYVIESA